MGVNLVPKVGGFRTDTLDFPKDKVGARDLSAFLGCISPGKHRVLRFYIHLHNIGDKDFLIGKPQERPDVFMKDPTGHYPYIFSEKFYTFKLTDDAGIEKKTGYKIAFCIMDFTNPDIYDCGNQGVAVGGHDEYSTDLPCQLVEIDGLPDGKYVLHVTCNAYSVQQVKSGQKPLFQEDNYDDNTVSVRLPITSEDGVVTPILSNEDFVKVADAKEIPPAQMKAAKVGDDTVCIANVGGNFYAIDNVCSHQGGPLAEGRLLDHDVQCPWHGSKFDVRTGEVTGPPANKPQLTYEIKMEDGSILVKKRRQ